ncbi:hypothetical protein Tco_0681314 [Tanacetum coccineum]|uniref:Uncharacterized protein n=1 Tax=Tanacetum coccineum TaxID=301880 RepID=A0ABQ4XN66_9ASTR
MMTTFSRQMNVMLSTQMLMINLLLSQYSWPTYPQLGQQIYKPVYQIHPSYLRYMICLSEVHDLVNTIDHCDDNQDEHETHNEVQQKHVIDLNGADMGNSNVIPYEHYLTINEVFVEPSCASSLPNNAYVLHDNNAYIPHDPLVTGLNIYKQQVTMYEQRAKFDLTLHEQKMDEQMSILIQDRNKKEENLKKELHSVKLQLNSTIKRNKIIEETVTALKHEFKQKETKFLTDF